jgi:hypothetical protein
MSIYTKQAIVATFAAYDVFKREADPRTGCVNITSADTLGLDSGRGYFRTYSPSSAASYALQYNECPIAAHADAVAKGHATHWINQNGSVLTAHARAKETLIQVEVGMLVCFEGHRFTIQPDHNHNLHFVAA